MLKRILFLMCSMFFIYTFQYSARSVIKESDAKLYLSKARKAYNAAVTNKTVEKYLSFKNILIAQKYIKNAEATTARKNWDKMAYYAVLSTVEIASALKRAKMLSLEEDKKKLSLKIIKYERDYYKKKASSFKDAMDKFKDNTDKTMGKTALLLKVFQSGLQQVGSSNNYKIQYSASKSIGLTRDPYRASYVMGKPLSRKIRNTLKGAAEVLKQVKSARIIIQTWSRRQSSRSGNISREYAKIVEEYLIERGVDESKITLEPLGRRSRADAIVIELRGVSP